MIPMDPDQLTSYVIKHLADEDDPNDIITDLCRMNDWSWSQAEGFVRSVQDEHEPEVVRRQFPLLTVLALGTFLGGFALIAYSVLSMIEGWNALTVLARGNLPPYDAMPHLRLMIDSSLGPFSGFFLGLAMLLGSLLGMREVWYALLYRNKG
jgi:hypothetical protein